MKKLQAGDVLLANEYQVRRGNHVSGLVLGPSELRPNEYLVTFTNGIAKDISPRLIDDLFVVLTRE